MGERRISVSRTIAAPAERIFDVLADPAMHARIDGSDTVLDSTEGQPRLRLGARFGMKMRIAVPYNISNEVVEFEEGRRLAWRHFGHHIWRYELEPVEGGTKVTESFDMTTAKSPLMLRLLRAPQRNRESIRATLERLAAVVADPGRSGR